MGRHRRRGSSLRIVVSMWMIVSSLSFICDFFGIPTRTMVADAFHHHQLQRRSTMMMIRKKAISNSLFHETTSSLAPTTTNIIATKPAAVLHSITPLLSSTGSYLDSLSSYYYDTNTAAVVEEAEEETTRTQSNKKKKNAAADSSSKTRQQPTTTPTTMIQKLNTVSDFLNYIDNAPTDTLCVVEFYGKNCPLCKKVAIKYKKIAKQFSKKKGNNVIRFAQMEHPANKLIMDILEIRTFPFLHVYRNGQCVASHGTESSIQFEYIVKDTIQRELEMTTDDWNIFLERFHDPIQRGTMKIEKLRNELL